MDDAGLIVADFGEGAYLSWGGGREMGECRGDWGMAGTGVGVWVAPVASQCSIRLFAIEESES